MKVSCSKAEAAIRHVDEAITFLFADRDPLAIRTLAAAAHGILSDLVEVKRPSKSWRSNLIEASGLTKKEALDILNHAQNYLKHADRDSNEGLTFEEEENDHVLFFATLECCELGHPLSFRMQVFQVWYLASYPEWIGTETELVKKATSAFRDIHALERQARLAEGALFLEALRPIYEDKLMPLKSNLSG